MWPLVRDDGRYPNGQQANLMFSFRLTVCVEHIDTATGCDEYVDKAFKIQDSLSVGFAHETNAFSGNVDLRHIDD